MYVDVYLITALPDAVSFVQESQEMSEVISKDQWVSGNVCS